MALAFFRHELIKWNGWGYKDSKFFLNKDGNMEFSGERYRISGSTMPGMKEWMSKTIGISLDHKAPAQVCLRILFLFLSLFHFDIKLPTLTAGRQQLE